MDQSAPPLPSAITATAARRPASRARSVASAAPTSFVKDPEWPTSVIRCRNLSLNRSWRSAASTWLIPRWRQLRHKCPITYKEMMMGHVPMAPVVFGSIILLLLGAENAFAQHPKGIVLCEAACSKFDKAC
jgi:hypothetical protein